MAYNVGTAQINIKPDLEGFRRDLKSQWEAMRKEMNRDGDYPELSPKFNPEELNKGIREWSKGAQKNLAKDLNVGGTVSLSVDKNSIRSANKAVNSLQEKVARAVDPAQHIDLKVFNLDDAGKMQDMFAAQAESLADLNLMERDRSRAMEQTVAAAERVDELERKRVENNKSLTAATLSRSRAVKLLEEAEFKEALARENKAEHNRIFADKAYRLVPKSRKGGKAGAAAAAELAELRAQGETLSRLVKITSNASNYGRDLVKRTSQQLETLQGVRDGITRSLASTRSAWEIAEASLDSANSRKRAVEKRMQDAAASATNFRPNFRGKIDLRDLSAALVEEMRRNPNEGAVDPIIRKRQSDAELSARRREQALYNRQNPIVLSGLSGLSGSTAADRDKTGTLGALDAEITRLRRIAEEGQSNLEKGIATLGRIRYESADHHDMAKQWRREEFRAAKELGEFRLSDITPRLEDIDRRLGEAFTLQEKVAKTIKYQDYGSDTWNQHYHKIPSLIRDLLQDRYDLESEQLGEIDSRGRLSSKAGTARSFGDSERQAGNALVRAASTVEAAVSAMSKQQILNERELHKAEVARNYEEWNQDRYGLKRNAAAAVDRSAMMPFIPGTDTRASVSSKAKKIGKPDIDTSGFDNLKMELGMLGKMGLRAAVQGAAIGTIGIAASGAIPAVAALGSAIGNVGKLAGLLPAMMSAGGVAMGVFLLATNGVVDGIKSLSETLGEDGLPVMEDYAEATKDMSEGMKAVADSIYLVGDGADQSLYQGLSDMQDKVQEAFLNPVADGMETMRSRLMDDGGIDELSASLEKLGGDFGRIVRNYSNFRFSDSGWADLNTQLGNFEILSESVVSSINKWQFAWNDLSTVGSQFLPELGQGLDNVVEKFSNFISTSRENGDIGQWFRSGIDSAKQLGSIVGSSFAIIRNVFRATSTDLDALNDSMERGLKSAKDYTASLEGSQTVSNFFSDTMTLGGEATKTLALFGQSVAEHVVPVLTQFTEGLAPKLRDAISQSGGLMDAIAPSAKTLGEAVGKAAEGFVKFGTWIEPFVSSTLPAFAAGLNAVAPALGALLGPLAHLIALRGVIDMFEKLVKYIGAAASVAGGKTLTKFAALAGAAMILADAFEPFGDLLKTLVDGLRSLDEALGGIPSKVLVATAAITRLRKAGGFSGIGASLSGKAKGLEGDELKKYVALNTAVDRTNKNLYQGKAYATAYGAAVAQSFGQAKQRTVDASKATTAYGRSLANLKGTATGVGAVISNNVFGAAGMGGAVKSAMSGVKTLGSGLLSLAGGPYVAAGLAGVAMWSAGQEHAKSYSQYLSDIETQTKNLAKAQDRVTDSMLEGATAQSAMADSFAKFDSDQASIADNDNGWLADFNAWTYNHGGNPAGGKEDAEKGAAAADAQKYQKALKELGYTTEDTARAALKSDSAWKKYKEELSDSGAMDSTIKSLDEFRNASLQGVTTYQSLSEETKRAAQTFAELRETGGAASGDLNKLREAYSGLRNDASLAAESTSQLTKVLDQTQQSVGSVAGSMADGATEIDLTTSSGTALYDALNQVGDAMATAVENGNSASDVWDQSSGALEALRLSAGAGETEWDNLLAKMNMTPERIETLMVIKTSTALTQLEGLHQAVLGAMEQGKTETTVQLDDAEAVQMARDLGYELTQIGENTYAVRLDSSSIDDANGKVDRGINQLSKFGEMKPRPFVELDTQQWDQKVLTILAQNDMIDSATPEAAADMDVSQFNQAQRVLLGSLIDLDTKKVWPGVDLDSYLFETKIGNAKTELDALDQEVINVDADGKISIDTSEVTSAKSLADQLNLKYTDIDGKIYIDDSSPQAVKDLLVALGYASYIDGKLVVSDNVAEVNERVDSLNGKRTDSNHYVNVVPTGYTALLAQAQLAPGGNPVIGVLGALSQAQADGGRLPKNSNGSRLPTTGPGTDKTDGILGVSADGTPMSWVDAGEWIINAKSSEKYDGLLDLINRDALPAFAGGGTAPGKGRKKDNAQIWQDVATGIATADRKSTQTVVNNNVNGAMSAVGGAADGIGLAGVAAGIPEFGEIPKAWDATQAELETKWSDFEGTAGNVWSNVQTIVDNAFKGIDVAVKTDWTDTQSWTLSQFSSLQASTASAFANINSTMTGEFRDAASDMQSTFSSGILPVFNALDGAVLNSVAGFQHGTAGINSAWSGIQEGTAGPVRYAVGTVWNGGLVPMWNSASELLGLQAMNTAPLAFATGGHVQGPGTETSDSIPAMLSDGEYVINAKATRKIGLDNLNALNSGNVAFAANAFRDKTFEDLAIRRASGGPVKGSKAWTQLKRGYDWAKSRNGRPYVWGGSANGDGGADCSGFMSGIADVILGGDGTRQWATMSFPGGQQGAWGPGLGAGFSVGISDVHTAGTIGGVEGMPAVNVESGGSNGGMSFGGPNAVGADDGQFNRQFHMLVAGDGAFMPGMGRAGGVSMSALAAEAIKPYQEKLAAMGLPYGEGLIGNLPRAVRDKAQPAMEDKIMEAAAAMQSTVGSAGVDLSGINGSVVQKVQEVFSRHGWTGSQWDNASWIIQKESGFNPLAVNPSSGAFGLFQFNPSSGTLQQYLPDRNPDPAVQANAGARYIKDRYGDPTGARGFWEQNGWYDQGGWLKPGVTRVTNETGKPEPVFNPAQWELIKGNIQSSTAMISALNSNESWAASQSRVDAQHQATLDARAAKEKANNDDDPDNDIEDEEITPVISMRQWDQIADTIGKKVRNGDVDGVRSELSNVFDILSEAAENVDWVDVMSEPMAEAKQGMIDGQVNDALGVFGIGSADSIPAVAASKKFQEDTKAQREKEAEDLEKSKDDYTDSDENIKNKQESLDDAKKDLAKLQEDLAGLTDPDDIADKQDAIKDKQDSIAKLEKELAKAKADKEKAKANANRLTADAYTGDSAEPLTDYVDPDADKKAEKAARDARREAKKEAEALEKKIDKKATGGWITGPGGPTADIIPLLGSAGEFMVRAASAGNAPHLLSAINADPGLASNLNDVFTGKIDSGSTQNVDGGQHFEYNIYANSVDEGMRRAEMHKRQQVAAYNPRR